MATQDRPADGAGPPDRSSWGWDDALRRLEELLLTYPENRALPPIDRVIADADVPATLLREDDRARKLIIEALLARPLSRVEVVSGLRTEVELLTLEVEVLTERLRQPEVAREEAAGAAGRLERVRGRLAEVRALL